MKKILVSPNSFKECADSVEIAEIISGFLPADFQIIKAPLSDGGDGFLKVILYTFKAEKLTFTTVSPLTEKISVNAAYLKSEKTVYIESADVIGLKLIPPEKRDPFSMNSSGLGILLSKIKNETDAEKIVIGIGGTGINDLGLGIVHSLGCRFYDASGNPVEPFPRNFHLITHYHWENKFDTEIELIADVNNPLTGENGAAYVYGPQKGLSPEQVKLLDKEFFRLAKLFSVENKIAALSGAGGGVAAGMQIFLNAPVRSSSDFILNTLKIKEYLETADYIITGEGSFDEQSFFGKGTGIIIGSTIKPVFLICGRIKKTVDLPSHVRQFAITDYYPDEQAVINFREGIKIAVQRLKL